MSDQPIPQEIWGENLVINTVLFLHALYMMNAMALSGNIFDVNSDYILPKDEIWLTLPIWSADRDC